MIVPLRHTFFAAATEDLDEAITSEVKRIVAARELTPLEWLDLLPPGHEELARLEVSFERSGSLAITAGANIRKRIGRSSRRPRRHRKRDAALARGLARGCGR